ncbi:hypothetical protein A3C09_04415 [Candidatus Uhrbacteria bacterium RIFCSPHIGHO2_02_FULL_47_44]|uniref:Uncharacterized protein n=1 Tax=Candidatus Uhrbacteria bacterium RIFCSPLOWO2_02_FULL_48_18 TaxID=1802408 RepID=A0A1F7VDU5_9BACT|nr:MAG: hypothetical protein A2839_02175 [Candidatus Uhrbacteria bacterium RIFCSPHIGHO2_01_FULL_47_10]OGL70149.1 MAG: hypothetical protein A3C09_04415 [Candidatus Uhrbacteria bacterium RIFCSPHIGHO2_02_FULL_47_44]OGL88157.1 MAG: hypothetical protein A3I41_00300 [Candidatus Uhrbacteria bacterium RIFCSPLOWO2_02_FULL_48_18]OGL92227.1 MAG: hypothetical protein A3H12_04630 [Candidatus Uhrbacteria bacterium RIFCSPLOWO2_12_FULL_47_9]
MAKQSWRIKLEQWLAANGDEGMSGVVDHLAILTRATSLVRKPGFKKALEKFLDEWAGLPEQKADPILRRLFEDETITIAPCDGSRYVAKEKGVFKAYIEGLFASWGLDKPGQSTVAANVSVYEMIRDATFAQMFGSLGPDLDKLCLSQHQIVEFCETHSARLRQEGYATFFLFKEGDQFCVARVDVFADGLCVCVYRLEDGLVWYGEFRPRLVVPQLTV